MIDNDDVDLKAGVPPRAIVRKQVVGGLRRRRHRRAGPLLAAAQLPIDDRVGDDATRDRKPGARHVVRQNDGDAEGHEEDGADEDEQRAEAEVAYAALDARHR